jgi:hypothetical protein
MEMYFQIQSDSGLLDDTSALRQWSMAYLGSLARTDVVQGRKDRHAPRRLNTMMTAAGFVDVEMSIRNVPMASWPEGKLPSKEAIVKRGLTSPRLHGSPNRPMELPQHEEFDESMGPLSSDKAQRDVPERLQQSCGQSGRRTGATAPKTLCGIVRVQCCHFLW